MDNNQIEATAKELKELYRAQKFINKKVEEKEKEIKGEMTSRSISELEIGVYKIKYLKFSQEKFDTKKFKMNNEALYNQFKKIVNTSKFTIDD